MKLERAYNARSTRPIWHWWKPDETPSTAGAGPIRTALCGATAGDYVLDMNTDHLRGCGKCDQRERKLTAK